MCMLFGIQSVWAGPKINVRPSVGNKLGGLAFVRETQMWRRYRYFVKSENKIGLTLLPRAKNDTLVA